MSDARDIGDFRAGFEPAWRRRDRSGTGVDPSGQIAVRQPAAGRHFQHRLGITVSGDLPGDRLQGFRVRHNLSTPQRLFCCGMARESACRNGRPMWLREPDIGSASRHGQCGGHQGGPSEIENSSIANRRALTGLTICTETAY